MLREIFNIIQCSNPCTCTPSATESQLYVVWDVSDQSSQPVLFDRDLGRFMVNTFVMELEYMFVQVR